MCKCFVWLAECITKKEHRRNYGSIWQLIKISGPKMTITKNSTPPSIFPREH